MTNRREFLRGATVLSATPLLNRVTIAIAGETVPLESVIYDSRHPAANEFATHAGMLGAPLLAIDGDITSVWQKKLVKHWQAAPAALLGLTERPALFLLERLAWEYGLRVVFEAEHVPDSAEHRVIRTGDAGLAHELAVAGRNWPRVLADHMISDTLVRARNFYPTSSALAEQPDEPVKLFSWIIAPRTVA